MSDPTLCYVCTECGWIYDPAQGDPDGGIAPGTPFEDIPDDWVCPVCGVSKDMFEPMQKDASETSSSTAEPDLVIVGSGLAGYSLAKEVRKRDAERAIMIITADGGEVYSKPMLSNALARGQSADDLVQKDAASQAKDLNLDIRSRARVIAIDSKARSLRVQRVSGEEQVSYKTLVLAMGADPRVFPAEGSEQVEIATVNDLDDYRLWRDRIGKQSHVLLIGAGLIGCEFANDLASAGFGVSMVDPAPWPLSRLLPEAMGERLNRALENLGCTLYMGNTVARYEKTASGYIAYLNDDTAVHFDHVLSAVGLQSRKQLASAAGLKTEQGICVDRFLQTSEEHIYALGDCAQTEAGPLPFIAPLLAQSRALAATLCGEKTALSLPALPVVVKTPALPLVVCPPKPGSQGDWQLELDGDDGQAIFVGEQGEQLGFALCGARTKQQRELAKQMPALIAESES